jgi:hypothetical protein
MSHTQYEGCIEACNVKIFPTMGILITKDLSGGELCPNTLP